jgi:hypothetical protein
MLRRHFPVLVVPCSLSCRWLLQRAEAFEHVHNWGGARPSRTGDKGSISHIGAQREGGAEKIERNAGEGMEGPACFVPFF